MNTTRDRILAAIAPAALVLAFQVVVFPIPIGVVLQGIVLGLINAMVVLGLVLVYRANRVINFAQASIGTFPAAVAGAVALFGGPGLVSSLTLGAASGAVVALRLLTVGRRNMAVAVGAAMAVTVLCAVGLHVASWFGYLGGLGVGVVAAILSGLGTHTIVISRLRTSPRLVLTVATIGLAQFFAICGLLVPRLWGQIALVDPVGDRTGFDVPFAASLTLGSTVFGSAELAAVTIAITAIAVIGFGLHRSDVGIAARAAADSATRASMLGVPVATVEAGVWVTASLLAFFATYAQAGILGLELTPGVGLRVMAAALGAMAIAGFAGLPAQLLAAVAIGLLVQATGPAGGHSLTLTDAVLAAVVLIGLLVRRESHRRSVRDTASSWQVSAEPRALPFELARIRVLRSLRVAGLVIVVAAAAAVPAIMGESTTLRAATLLALVLIALSVVVLTGWAGGITLGQMSFAATGAAVAAAATTRWQVDITFALLLGGAAGGMVAGVVGLPSIRRSGMFLAVSTLAFALAATNYLLNPTVVSWIPTGDVGRRPLFGVWRLDSRASIYLLTLVVVVLCFAAAAGVRRTRVGRTLRAVRDNPPGAQAYGISVPVARLLAFAFSGFLAGVGGVLLFSIHERYEVALFSANESINVFISAVVGGVGSMLGAVVGAVTVDGSRGFLSGPLSLLPSAAGVLGVLLILPGGLADLLYRLRDQALRRFAARRGIEVPSLVADRRLPDPLAGERHAMPLEVGHPEPPAEPGVLSVRGLDVAYDQVQVLFGVDLDIERATITALLGTNGAGKSTLLKAIGGVAPITAGTIRFDGVDLRRLRPEAIAALGIAQMPGGHGVFPSLTVDENLRVAAWLLRRDRTDAQHRIDEARHRFPVLDARRDEPAADLSGGQQQQLALAMALLATPKVLLVDELSVGLAPVVVESLLGVLRSLRDAGTTIVIVEQSVNLALTVADHAYFMEKGEIRFSGDAHALMAQPELVRSVYLRGARDALAVTTPRPAQHRVGNAVPALEVEELYVTFGGNAAVGGASIEVAAGEIVGLIGPNGAGKTTVLDVISGFTPVQAGRVLLHGDDITRLSPSARARRGIGRSFQDARLFPGLTVAETIAVALNRWIDGDGLVAGAFGLPDARYAERLVDARVDELIELFGLQAFRSKRIAELSTGSRRMVDLACVVAHSPSVLLLDEPTSGIAQREAEALGPLLVGLRDQLEATLVIVEHDISLISSIAHRLVALDRGVVVCAGSPAEVLDHPEVVASYLGMSTVAVARSDHGQVRR
jgi:ABC-type branched-subunit amino acid transport system ATPase component/ABC-type branched-subunit amino acid transport system permease subunit